MTRPGKCGPETSQRSRLASEFRTKAPFIVPISTRALPFFGLTNVLVSTEPPDAFAFFQIRYRTMPESKPETRTSSPGFLKSDGSLGAKYTRSNACGPE